MPSYSFAGWRQMGVLLNWRRLGLVRQKQGDHPGFMHSCNFNLCAMWVIKYRSSSLLYLERMISYPDGGNALNFGEINKAFRFPDEATAQAVLKFLNRDNLEVVCIDHPGSGLKHLI